MASRLKLPAQEVRVGDMIYLDGFREVVFVNVRKRAKSKHVRIETAIGTMLNYNKDESVLVYRRESSNG